MTKRRLRNWVNRRFVLIAEATGYLISGAVGVFLLYAVFTRVDVMAAAEGQLKPAALVLTAPGQAIVLEYLEPDRAVVKKGQALLKVSTDPRAQKLILARRHLEKAGSLLVDETSLHRAVSAAEALMPDLPPGDVLAAPRGGSFVRLATSDADDVVAAGQPLAWIYDFGDLSFEGVVSDQGNNTKVFAGQAVRMRLKDVAAPLDGLVTRVEQEGAEARIEVRVTGASTAFSDSFRAASAGKVGPEIDGVKAEIVLGQRTLFGRIFGRR